MIDRAAWMMLGQFFGAAEAALKSKQPAGSLSGFRHKHCWRRFPERPCNPRKDFSWKNLELENFPIREFQIQNLLY
jgi:hypothetical protein